MFPASDEKKKFEKYLSFLSKKKLKSNCYPYRNSTIFRCET